MTYVFMSVRLTSTGAFGNRRISFLYQELNQKDKIMGLSILQKRDR